MVKCVLGLASHGPALEPGSAVASHYDQIRSYLIGELHDSGFTVSLFDGAIDLKPALPFSHLLEIVLEVLNSRAIGFERHLVGGLDLNHPRVEMKRSLKALSQTAGRGKRSLSHL